VPFHVPLAGRSSLTGFVMCEQVKSLDFRSRHMKRIESAPKELLDDALALIDAAIF
jgi:mRNA interferase MazF